MGSKIERRETFHFDGVDYPTLDAAAEAEAAKEEKLATLFSNYLTSSYAAGSVLKEHDLGSKGVWAIYGEGQGDLGSPPPPLLGHARGTLRDVIRYGVGLPNFFNWGGGGRFEKIDIIDIEEGGKVADAD